MGRLDPSEDQENMAEAFWQRVGANLREGHLRLVFVADEIPAGLRRLVEFLNEQMPRVEVLAVEIRQYRAPGSNSGALVPRLVGQTARAQAAKEQPPPSPAAGTVDRRSSAGINRAGRARPSHRGSHRAGLGKQAPEHSDHRRTRAELPIGDTVRRLWPPHLPVPASLVAVRQPTG